MIYLKTTSFQIGCLLLLGRIENGCKEFHQLVATHPPMFSFFLPEYIFYGRQIYPWIRNGLSL